MSFKMPAMTAPDRERYTHAAVDNTEVKQFITDLNIIGYENIPAWMDDCCYGATGQLGHSDERLSPARILGILRCLDSISSKTVGQLLNRKREALGDELYSDRHVRRVAQVVRCASQAITYHKNFQPTTSAVEIAECKPLPYSDEEMKVIKHLSLNAPFAELKAYEETLKAKYGTEA